MIVEEESPSPYSSPSTSPSSSPPTEKKQFSSSSSSSSLSPPSPSPSPSSSSSLSSLSSSTPTFLSSPLHKRRSSDGIPSPSPSPSPPSPSPYSSSSSSSSSSSHPPSLHPTSFSNSSSPFPSSSSSSQASGPFPRPLSWSRSNLWNVSPTPQLAHDLARFSTTHDLGHVTLNGVVSELIRQRAEIAELKRKIKVHEMLQDQWAVRYAKRAAVISNFLLGTWIFWTRLQDFIRGSRGRVMQILFPSVVPKIRKTKTTPSETVNALLLQSLFYSVHHSWIFFFAGFLLTRPVLWKRISAVVLSCVWSLYLGQLSHLWPWSNYCNIMTNLLYITATKGEMTAFLSSIQERFFGENKESRDNIFDVPKKNGRIPVGRVPSPPLFRNGRKKTNRK